MPKAPQNIARIQPLTTLTLEVLDSWKDTRESRRAVLDAVPFLKTAKRVVVVEVVVDDDEIPDARRNTRDVCDWLERHNIAAEPLAVTIADYATPLDEVARKEDADLIVAGAYGHSRFREWALGGVTRDLLEKSERCSLLSR